MLGTSRSVEQGTLLAPVEIVPTAVLFCFTCAPSARRSPQADVMLTSHYPTNYPSPVRTDAEARYSVNNCPLEGPPPGDPGVTAAGGDPVLPYPPLPPQISISSTPGVTGTGLPAGRGRIQLLLLLLPPLPLIDIGSTYMHF